MRPIVVALLCCASMSGTFQAHSRTLQRAPERTQEQIQERTPEQAAFAQARAVTAPEARVTALKDFVAKYPRSALAKRAAALELDTLLRSFPDRTVEIHALAAVELAAVPVGFERWAEEARLADMLASAGSAGADLPDAKLWAQHAVEAMTEGSYGRQIRAMEARYRLPPLTARERHREFVQTRASFLAALANADLRANEADGALRALDEAEGLDPLLSEVSRLRGQIALAQGRDHEALEAFERAEAEGDLKEPWRGEMIRLYRQSHAQPTVAGAQIFEETTGAAMPTGLNDAIDALYAKLFPPAFALSPRRLPAGGHTVLLELFTGSGCEPCAAPDLAVESLLGSYGRQDLAVLEYDEHIPRPDPLANPDSVDRAAAYGVGTTPEAFLDGMELPVVGAARSDVENVVVSFADELEDRAAVATGIDLQLTVKRLANGTLQASATATKANARADGSAAAHRLPAHPQVRFALVEDHIRYSGENGIRFHRMVVRALAAQNGPDLTRTAMALPIQATFDPAAISRDQTTYLTSYEKSNDRFGAVRFLTTNIPIDPAHLAMTAWIEDPVTHEVLQTAFAKVPKQE